ncbi:hypothetical protein CHISP_3115 [Chitinispirillum alkaliphilum]|nr:hypothetical protein CHISP_3115 [Chitinispirillum alkaliphilum]
MVRIFAFFPEKTDAEVTYSLDDNVSEIFITTQDGETLQCFYIEVPETEKTLIYFHGNAGNIYNRMDELKRISQIGVNVLGVGYRGYGKSSGRATEEGIYNDGWAAFDYVVNDLGVEKENLFLMGRSLGTTVTLNLARNKNLGGLILITPLTSAYEYAKSKNFGVFARVAGNAFNSVKFSSDIQTKTLVIHGTADEVTPYWMGERIYDLLTTEKKFVTISGGRHNCLEYTDSALYWGSIEEIIKGNN